MNKRSLFFRAFMIFSFLFTLTACGHVDIKNPPTGRTYLLTPHDLSVRVYGGTFCSYKANSFRFVLDIGEANELDISNNFTRSAGSYLWDSQSYPLPLGNHKLFSEAEFKGGFCLGKHDSSSGSVVVSQPTCVKGKVLQHTGDISQAVSWSGATIKVQESQTGTVVAEDITDASGNYCIDNIPTGGPFDILVPEQVDQNGNTCIQSQPVLNVTLSNPNSSCVTGSCNNFMGFYSECSP